MRRDDHASFLSRLMNPRHAAPPPLDPADYCTAFGLDLSMEGGLPHSVHASAAPEIELHSGPPEGWLARWWRRTG